MSVENLSSMLAERAAITPFLGLQVVITLAVIRSVRVSHLLGRGGAWRALVAGILFGGLLIAIIGLRIVNTSLLRGGQRQFDPLLVAAFGITQVALLGAMFRAVRRRNVAGDAMDVRHKR